MVTAWAGMRGAVSLAAALTLPLALPDGRAFPQRDLIVFLTFVVIVVTLLGQGLTLPLVVRRLVGGGSEMTAEAREEAAARREAADAAMARLEQMQRDDPGGAEIVDQLRRRVRNRMSAADEQLAAIEMQARADPADSDPRSFLEPRQASVAGRGELPRDTYRRFGQAMITAERARLLFLRDEGRLAEEAFVRIERELDLEQAALLVR